MTHRPLLLRSPVTEGLQSTIRLSVLLFLLQKRESNGKRFKGMKKIQDKLETIPFKSLLLSYPSEKVNRAAPFLVIHWNRTESKTKTDAFAYHNKTRQDRKLAIDSNAPGEATFHSASSAPSQRLRILCHDHNCHYLLITPRREVCRYAGDHIDK